MASQVQSEAELVCGQLVCIDRSIVSDLRSQMLVASICICVCRFRRGSRTLTVVQRAPRLGEKALGRSHAENRGVGNPRRGTMADP